MLCGKGIAGRGEGHEATKIPFPIGIGTDVECSTVPVDVLDVSSSRRQ